MRHEQEAPRGRRGHPGGLRRAGGAPRGAGARRDAGWGRGAAVPALVPAGSRGAGCAARSGRALRSRGGGWRGGPGGPSSPPQRALTPRPLSHTHSLTLPYTPTERQPRTTAGTSAERGGGRRLAKHGRGCRKSVAKGSGSLRPARAPAARRLSVPRRGRHPEDRVEGAGQPLPKAATGRTTWTVPTVARAPDYNAQNAPASAGATPPTTPPRTVGTGWALHHGICSPR